MTADGDNRRAWSAGRDGDAKAEILASLSTKPVLDWTPAEWEIWVEETRTGGEPTRAPERPYRVEQHEGEDAQPPPEPAADSGDDPAVGRAGAQGAPDRVLASRTRPPEWDGKLEPGPALEWRADLEPDADPESLDEIIPPVTLPTPKPRFEPRPPPPPPPLRPRPVHQRPRPVRHRRRLRLPTLPRPRLSEIPRLAAVPRRLSEIPRPRMSDIPRPHPVRVSAEARVRVRSALVLVAVAVAVGALVALTVVIAFAAAGAAIHHAVR